MADTQSDQASGASRLSAEAKVFIPVIPERNDGSSTCSDIPDYMTNCYPFVQNDPTTFMQNGVRWQTPQPQGQGGRGRGRGQMRGTPPGHFSGYTTPYGNFPPPFNITPAMVPAAPYQPIMEPQYPMGLPNMTIGQPTPFTNAQGVYDGGQAFLAALNQTNAPQKRGRRNANMGGRSRSNSGGGGGGGNGGKRNNKNNNNKSTDNPGKVSVGIQNEAGGPGGGNNKKKQRKKIIILMDIAIQTDFNDEIANLTLAERPNSLFQKQKQRTRRKASNIPTNISTDTEDEVDSDSGYSSPLHRRNLTSSGTHPVNSLLNNVPSTSTDSAPQGSLSISPLVKNAMYQTSKTLEIPAVLPPTGNIQYVSPVSVVPSGDVLNYVNPAPAGDVKMSYASAAKAPPVARTDISANNTPQDNAEVGEHETDDLKKKKRKRKRNRKRKKKGDAEDGENGEVAEKNLVSKPSDKDADTKLSNSRASFDALTTETAPLHFEDENEFPGLGPAPGKEPPRALTYSDILQTTTAWPYVSPALQKPWQTEGDEQKTIQAWRSNHPETMTTAEDQASEESADLDKTAKENKVARKRRKRREMANIAAERELMEISLEQQFLKEIGPKATKPTPPQNTGKKSKQPIALNIAEMISALENTKTKKPEPVKEVVPEVKKKPATEYETILNVLDSCAPQVKRGKEREMPKNKKPSTLKKVILKEREEKKKARLFEDPEMVNPEYTGIPIGEGEAEGEDYSQEVEEEKREATIEEEDEQDKEVEEKEPVEEEKVEETDKEERNERQLRLLLQPKDLLYPHSKKPVSSLKRKILIEREIKRRLGIGEDDEDDILLYSSYTGLPPGCVQTEVGRVSEEVVSVQPYLTGYWVSCIGSSDMSQDTGYCNGMSSKMSDMFTPASNDMSPISQTSPISMSPLSPGSPLSSGVNSPIAGGLNLNKSPAALKLHSRRFREYCNQVIDKDIDDCCTLLLQDLVRFQDRLYHKDPVKAKSKRRIVLGLREVTKHLKLKKIKFVIISPNMERVKAKGGLDDALNNIIHMCTEQTVPFVFALGRRALGRACAKLVPVSVAGVFNYEGSEENFHKLMELTKDARQQYAKMVKEMEAEEINHIKNVSNQPIYAHMGHSRTPSGCSAISFASSLLSEPISENDNDYDFRKVDDKSPSLLTPKDRRQYLTHSRNSSLGKVSIAESIDEGNEADTEELNDAMLKHMNIILDKDDPLNSKIDAKIDPVNSGKIENLSGADNLTLDSGMLDSVDALKSAEIEKLSCFREDIGGATEEFEDNDNDTVEELPHIDSIHNLCGLDFNNEMLSQHSEVLSTHSSKTLGANTPIKGNTTPVDHHSDPEVTPLTLAQRIKSLDKERIESWVEEAKTCIQDLKISESEGELTVGEGTDVDS